MTTVDGSAGAPELAAELRRIPALFQAAVARATLDELRKRPAAGEWSAVEVLGHMVDKMTVWRGRVLLIAAQDDPAIAGFDQNARVLEMRYQEADAGALTARLAAACEAFAATVEPLAPAALRREGIHSEMGRITARDCVTVPINAARAHLAQLEATLGIAQT